MGLTKGSKTRQTPQVVLVILLFTKEKKIKVTKKKKSHHWDLACVTNKTGCLSLKESKRWLRPNTFCQGTNYPMMAPASAPASFLSWFCTTLTHPIFAKHMVWHYHQLSRLPSCLGLGTLCPGSCMGSQIQGGRWLLLLHPVPG